MRDRTQLADLESEIGAFRGTTELLRAQTHEFMNQLHTISGLIQIGDYEEVVSYVDALTEGRAALDLTVASRYETHRWQPCWWRSRPSRRNVRCPLG